MHAPPAIQLFVHRFEVWRCALLLAALLVLATLAAWALSVPSGRGWAILPGGVLLLPLWSAAHPSPFSLRWDSQCWHLGPVAERGCESVSGQLRVALDFGGWMLLRLEPAGSTALKRRVRWLPVQRAGHESAWHVFRCTVYSAGSRSSRLAGPIEAFPE